MAETAGSAPATSDTTDGAGVGYLLARVRLVENNIRMLVAHRRIGDPAPDDPFRGLYLSEEAVDRILAGPSHPPEADVALRQQVELAADTASAGGSTPRLRQLADDFRLTQVDVELLLIALLPDLDSRFEKLYGYLNDDVTRRRATIGLALELLRVPSVQADARARLHPASPLLAAGLMVIDETDRPFLTRALRVPDRVTAHLLGDDTPDQELLGVLTEPLPVDSQIAACLGRALAAGQRLVHLRETLRGSGSGLAAAALGHNGTPVIGVDLDLLAAGPRAADLVTVIGREAGLTGAAVVAEPAEALAQPGATRLPDALRALAALSVPVIIVGSSTWDPTWSPEVPLQMDAPGLTAAGRGELWRKALALHPQTSFSAAEGDEMTGNFVLGPAQIDRAVRSAAAIATLNGGSIDATALRRGARSQNAAGLERLARRIEPAVGWDDIVLPPTTVRQLRDVTDRARHRDTVLSRWRMRPGGGRGRGVLALFAGDSGTGKTMAAEVVAGDLGLDLYTVNLATVVDKYVGETEKNLERIFTEAGGVNAVLLFDEADAVFGKRSEVRDAHDRYANIESAYLLQRMETFDGLAVLSTNLRSNIDEAFTRRLDSIIDFPAPDENARLALWRRCLASPLPCADDLDLQFCARSFTLSGGNIRSAAITAAYLAAAEGRAVGMTDVITSIQQEYRKLGRLVLDREFGGYLTSGVR